MNTYKYRITSLSTKKTALILLNYSGTDELVIYIGSKDTAFKLLDEIEAGKRDILGNKTILEKEITI